MCRWCWGWTGDNSITIGLDRGCCNRRGRAGLQVGRRKIRKETYGISMPVEAHNDRGSHQENWFLLFLDLNGSKCIYSTIDATIASISLIASIDI
jgi:hypothetical protein